MKQLHLRHDRGAASPLVVLAAVAMLSVVAVAGIWYTVVDTPDYTVELSVDNVRAAGDEVHLDLLIRVTNRFPDDILVTALYAKVFTSEDRTTEITTLRAYGLAVPAGEQVVHRAPLVLRNLEAVEDALYVEVTLRLLVNGESIPYQDARTVSLP